jgi:hypothetical protein
MKKHAWILFTIITLALVAAGCGKGGSATGSTAFDKADPETKANWQNAVSASGTNDYARALFTLRSLQAKGNLTKQQTEAVSDLYTKVNAAMMEAFDRGDTNAKAAMDMMRQLRGR